MKKLVMTVAVLLALIPLESFQQQSAIDKNNENKIGVWKTYDDFGKGILTDLGGVTENPKAWKDGAVFFDKEHVIPKETNYWGARLPLFEYKANSFVNHSIPVPNTSHPYIFNKGHKYSILMSPMPIGIYSNFAGYTYDANGNLTEVSFDEHTAIYASKGKGDLILSWDRKNIRTLFDDDPEIQKAYDAENPTKKETKHFLPIFIKYATLYNKKHTPGYVARIKSYDPANAKGSYHW